MQVSKVLACFLAQSDLGIFDQTADKTRALLSNPRVKRTNYLSSLLAAKLWPREPPMCANEFDMWLSLAHAGKHAWS